MNHIYLGARLLTPLALVLSCTVAWAGPTSDAADGADQAQRVFEKVAASVVTVQVLEGQGSGVVVAPGQVATNCHVVRDESAIRVVTTTGEFKATWTRQLHDVDLCLLSVPELKAAPVVLRRSDTLAVGEPAYAVGNPLGFGLAVSAGLVTIVQKDQPYALLVATAAQSPGSSGGGLFDREGRLLGLTTAVLGTGQNLNKIVVADGIPDLLAKGTPPPPVAAVPEPEVRWYAVAEGLQDKSEWDKLERHALAWSRAQPNAAAAWIFMGIAQSKLSRPPDAEASLQRALVLDAHSPFAWRTEANMLFYLDRPDEAEQALARAEALWPGYAEPQRERAHRLLVTKQPEAALLQIRESLRKRPERTWSWEQLGAIQEALGHRPEAIAAYNTALRLGSTQSSIKVRLAALAAEQGDASLAARSSLLKGATPVEEARMLLEVADLDQKAGRTVQAEAALRKAVSLSPDSAAAWSALGGVLRSTQRMDAADEAFSKAIALEPKEPAWLANRAETRRVRKQYEPALADARAALALAPDKAFTLLTHARLLLDTRMFRDANTAFAKANAVEPLSPANAIAWADVRVTIGDADGALKLLRQVEKNEPLPPGFNLVMAKALGREDERQASLVYIERSLMLDPTDAVAWSSKGYSLMKLNRLPEATEALETAVRLDPQLANSWINLGEAQMRSLKLGRAIEALEKGLLLAPDAIDARVYLAQTYMAARLPAKARQQGEKLLEKRPGDPPALGFITLAYLMEGNSAAASETYMKLKTAAPPTAKYVRERALAAGLTLANSLPE